METEQLTTACKLGQDWSHERKKKLCKTEWKWKYSLPKLMGHCEGSPKKMYIAQSSYIKN